MFYNGLVYFFFFTQTKSRFAVPVYFTEEKKTNINLKLLIKNLTTDSLTLLCSPDFIFIIHFEE